jgi:hypothetical protein
MAIEHKFEEPTPNNVEKGDYLVVIDSGTPGLISPTINLEEITKITKDKIESDKHSIRYSEAIVIKSYSLVGKNIQKYMYPKSSN